MGAICTHGPHASTNPPTPFPLHTASTGAAKSTIMPLLQHHAAVVLLLGLLLLLPGALSFILPSPQPTTPAALQFGSPPTKQGQQAGRSSIFSPPRMGFYDDQRRQWVEIGAGWVRLCVGASRETPTIPFRPHPTIQAAGAGAAGTNGVGRRV